METPTRKLPVVARVLLGLPFTVFGANALLGFLPAPPVAPAGGAFLGALAATGYMLPLLVAVEVGAGLLLLAGRAVPLAQRRAGLPPLPPMTTCRRSAA